MEKSSWLVVWNMIFLFFHSVGNVIIPTDSYVLRGVAQPPTRYKWGVWLLGSVSIGMISEGPFVGVSHGWPSNREIEVQQDRHGMERFSFSFRTHTHMHIYTYITCKDFYRDKSGWIWSWPKPSLSVTEEWWWMKKIVPTWPLNFIMFQLFLGLVKYYKSPVHLWFWYNKIDHSEIPLSKPQVNLTMVNSNTGFIIFWNMVSNPF